MSTTYRAFLGDKDHDFYLTPPLVEELERLTEVGIGSLCKRLFAGDFSYADICQTIRLALIGGGTDPQEAANLVAIYVTGAPLARVYPLAVSILEATWFGTDDRELTEGEGANV